ncbi:MAG TPA: tetratricopeptide repeat protein [bacterium (Candidatus Stahlbacteria)]|nr:tetratricopeptide repeat protein [Candidatus Stahlbacteria bacterium]
MILLLIITLATDSLFLSYDYFSRGYQHELEGKFEKAIDLYEQAKKYALDGDEIDYYIARIKFMTGNYKAAKQLVNRLLKEREDFDYYQLLGDCEIKSGEIDRAIEYYKKALALRDDDFLKHHLATILETIGRLEAALGLYQELMLSSEDAELATRIASLLGRLGRPRMVIDFLLDTDIQKGADYFLNLGIAYDQLALKDSALVNYKKVLEIDSTDTTVLKRLLDLYIQIDSLDQADAVGARALKLAPHDPALHRSIGYLDYKKGRMDESLLHFLISSGMNHSDLYSHYYIGRIFFEKREYGMARDYLMRALKIDPQFPDVRLYLGLLEMDQKRYREARRHFKKAMSYGFDRAEGTYLVGLSRAMEGDFEEAYLDFKEALRFNPENPKLLSSLGDICDDLKRYDEALEYFSQVIELDSTNAVALNYVGYTLAERSESLNYALELVQRALRVDSTNGYYIDSLGWIYFQMGDYNTALRELLRARSIVEDAVILEHLGDVYLKLNELNKAKEAYERAISLDPENESLMKKISDIKARY